MQNDSERDPLLFRQPFAILTHVAIPLALALIGLVALSATAAAQEATSTPTPTATPTPGGPTPTPVPGLTLSPQQGPPNTSVAATGTNFAAGDSVQLLFNGVQVDSKQADTTGLVNFQFNVPTLANGQYPVLATGKTRGSASVNFTISGTSVTLSSQQGPPGTSLTITGNGFQPGETVAVDFNGAGVGTPIADTNGSFRVTFPIPTIAAGNYQIEARGQTSGDIASATFTVGGATVSLSAATGPVGASITANGSGFVPGEAVRLVFAGSPITQQNANTNGSVTFNFMIPNVTPGSYFVVLAAPSGAVANAAFEVTSGGPTPAPTPTPGPSVTPQPAPPIPHDDRYFPLTGYRIDNDQVNAFFETYGAVPTFGYPTSRTFNFLGCPVQFFQRQVIQVCPNQGAALINILDPEIFPYTMVNGSSFPPPDNTMKANTPQVSDPNYSTAIITFINQNVPNTFSGQPVGFLDHFNNQGSLVIWGAPISPPAPDPTNQNFIYQRFQRGIMHYIAGTGTESILVADYLKSLILDQNVPLDLHAQAVAMGSPYLRSYCPGQPLWMCQPNQVPGTDYTFAFVPG
ncbi:MAG: hypothetical protein J2P17_21605 [Mycobacterium sp.]|nr:hypothetical protein [Mycobacterium sp.]